MMRHGTDGPLLDRTGPEGAAVRPGDAESWSAGGEVGDTGSWSSIPKANLFQPVFSRPEEIPEKVSRSVFRTPSRSGESSGRLRSRRKRLTWTYESGST